MEPYYKTACGKEKDAAGKKRFEHQFSAPVKPVKFLPLPGIDVGGMELSSV